MGPRVSFMATQLVNTEFAAQNEYTVKAFLAAVAAGWKDAIKDPSAPLHLWLNAIPQMQPLKNGASCLPWTRMS